MKRILKNNTEQKGITLIALVVTIAVLLILAAVTIQFTLGDNGIVQQAKDAVNEQKNAVAQDEATMNSLLNELRQLREEMNSEGSEEIHSGGSEGTESTGETADDRIEVSNVTKQTYNQYAQDIYENLITIPAGFHIVAHGTNNISYTYAGDTAHTPTVQDGIVIADDEGNQFTWVPVGTINNKTGDTRGTTTTINLGRYVFKSDGSLPTDSSKMQVITEYDDNSPYTNIEAEAHKISSFYKELAETLTTGQAIAKDNGTLKGINGFLKSAIENHGYYMARFEAGVTNYDANNIATSQSGTAVALWTGYTAETGKTLKVVSKQGEQVWNYITQSKAAEVAQEMYATNNNYVSDLVNSFAWDTAIVFIDTYGYTPGSNSKKYAAVNVGPNDGLKLSGTSKNDVYSDNYCNIYDMSGNYSEWNTECYAISSVRCTYRGGAFPGARIGFTASRGDEDATDSLFDLGFRSLLYVALTTAE